MSGPKHYSEIPVRKMHGFITGTDIYSNVQDALILDCVDFVAVNRQHRTVLLAKRIVHSAKGVWRFGGRRRAGETMQAALMRLSNRELGISVNYSRFVYVIGQDCIWSWREQEPQFAGQHSFIHLFAIEFTEDELDRIRQRLDPREFDTDFGLREFRRDTLIRNNARPQLIEMYDCIFPD